MHKLLSLQQPNKSVFKQRRFQNASRLGPVGYKQSKQTIIKPWMKPELEEYFELMVDSYKKETGHDLIDTKENIIQKIWDADFPLLAHDMAMPPVFVYLNQAALKVFDCEWQDIINKPSYVSADLPERQEREKKLKQCLENGHIAGKNLKRMSFKKIPIFIHEYTLFNISDSEGKIIGQAAKLIGYEKLKTKKQFVNAEC